MPSSPSYLNYVAQRFETILALGILKMLPMKRKFRKPLVLGERPNLLAGSPKVSIHILIVQLETSTPAYRRARRRYSGGLLILAESGQWGGLELGHPALHSVGDKCNDSLCKFSHRPFILPSLTFRRSRTFMRSLVSEPNVGLLLFDEPSASLDPTAEHG